VVGSAEAGGRVRGLARPGHLAAGLLTEIMPLLVRVGGSAAQREVIEDTWLFCLLNDGRLLEATALLEGRLERRPSPLDRRRLAAAARAPGA
jgi:hypothetical protein